jgi:hypothetical protein
MTSKEAQVKYAAGEEIKLQTLCMNWLLLHDIYFEWDRTDKGTSGKRGGQTFASVLKGDGFQPNAKQWAKSFRCSLVSKLQGLSVQAVSFC